MLYYFDNKKSNQIIENYGLSIFIMFNDDEKIRGLRKLYRETKRQLEFYKTVDDYGIFLNMESIRFMCHLVANQKMLNNIYSDYYSKLLDFFHDNNLLMYKKKYAPYNEYQNKQPTIKINYKFNGLSVPITYYSLKDLKNDYGRYKTEKILKNYKNNNYVNYEDILNLII